MGFNSYCVAAARFAACCMNRETGCGWSPGPGMGSALSVYVVGLFNQTIWPNPDPHSTLHSWRDLIRAWGWARPFMVVIVLARVPELYGPVALFSVLGVIVLFVTVNGLTWILVTRQAGRMRAQPGSSSRRR